MNTNVLTSMMKLAVLARGVRAFSLASNPFAWEAHTHRALVTAATLTLAVAS